MKQLYNIIYDSRPETITIYPTMVDVILLCEEIITEDHESSEEPLTVVKYKCNLARYTIYEYIGKITKENGMLEDQITELQVAITEAFETMIG